MAFFRNLMAELIKQNNVFEFNAKFFSEIDNNKLGKRDPHFTKLRKLIISEAFIIDISNHVSSIYIFARNIFQKPPNTAKEFGDYVIKVEVMHEYARKFIEQKGNLSFTVCDREVRVVHESFLLKTFAEYFS